LLTREIPEFRGGTSKCLEPIYPILLGDGSHPPVILYQHAESGMMESAEDRSLIRGGDITALDAILTAMFARLQGVDPLIRVICSQVFEDAARSVEARVRYINADKIDLLSALNKIESIREIALAQSGDVSSDKRPSLPSVSCASQKLHKN
jgi:hypothetical protein